ncbi:unnamed protein product [Merluccius merluccius]
MKNHLPPGGRAEGQRVTRTALGSHRGPTGVPSPLHVLPALHLRPLALSDKEQRDNGAFNLGKRAVAHMALGYGDAGRVVARRVSSRHRGATGSPASELSPITHNPLQSCPLILSSRSVILERPGSGVHICPVGAGESTCAAIRFATPPSARRVAVVNLDVIQNLKSEASQTDGCSGFYLTVKTRKTPLWPLGAEPSRGNWERQRVDSEPGAMGAAPRANVHTNRTSSRIWGETRGGTLKSSAMFGHGTIPDEAGHALEARGAGPPNSRTAELLDLHVGQDQRWELHPTSVPPFPKVGASAKSLSTGQNSAAHPSP